MLAVVALSYEEEAEITQEVGIHLIYYKNMILLQIPIRFP